MMPHENAASPAADPGARPRERGSALVLAVFVLVLLTGMGTALLFLSESELKMTRADLRSKDAFYLAEAGLEDGRMTLFDRNGASTDFGSELLAASGGTLGNGTIDFDPFQIRPTFDAADNLTGFSAGVGDDVPLRGITAFGDGFYTAYLMNDGLDTTTSIADSNSRVIVAGVGVGPDRSVEIVQAIVEPYQPLPPVPPAAIMMLGPPRFDNGNSNAQSHSGDDCYRSPGLGIPGLYVPILGGVGSSYETALESQMRRPEHFSSGPHAGTETVGDMIDPTDPVVNGNTVSPEWTDCPSLKSMIEGLAASARYFCDTDRMTCSPPASNPGEIIFIDGDFSTSGFHSGVLVVTGQLTYNGNSGWNGIVLVIGEGYVNRNGGGSGNPSGAVVVANIDPSPDGPRADKSDWCTGGVENGFGTSDYNTNGGGNSTVEYCTHHINASNPVTTYLVTEFVQR